MHRTLAPHAVSLGLLVAALLSACRPQYVAPNDELRADTRPLSAHGVTVTAPASVREEPGSAPAAREYAWRGPRVWVSIQACKGVADDGLCASEGKGLPRARVEGAEIRRSEDRDANTPRAVVWVTPDGATRRTVVLIIGRTLGDSALVRRIADSVQPVPE